MDMGVITKPLRPSATSCVREYRVTRRGYHEINLVFIFLFFYPRHKETYVQAKGSCSHYRVHNIQGYSANI